MKYSFLKFKDAKMVCGFIGLLMQSIGTTLLVLGLFFGLLESPFWSSCMISGLLLVAFSIFFNSYASNESRFLHSIEADGFELIIDANAKSWNIGPLMAIVNGQAVLLNACKARKMEKINYKMHLNHGKETWSMVRRYGRVDDMEIDIYAAGLNNLCVVINGEIVVSNNMIDFKAIERVTQR